LPKRLEWPPQKEDLERLYLVEKLSAAKIAKVYGLVYKNPKVAESTVLYQLKRNGIKRRERAEHSRKVIEQMVDEWVKRYQAGESLKRIAADELSPVTVFNHLRKRGIVLRDKVEAQIRSVRKYERFPFKGDKVEKAYLMGLRYGDLHAVRHGRGIRVRVSTTHPSLAELFDGLSSPYAHVSRYPREAKLVGYEWTLECDLDESFRFLLFKPTVKELEAFSSEEMVAFLAGLFDAEGSIILHNKRGRLNPEATFSSTDEGLLLFVRSGMELLGLHCKLDWTIQNQDRQGITGYSRKGWVVLWRFYDVQKLLQILPLRHMEKLSKARIVMGMEYRSSKEKNLETGMAWDSLVSGIKLDVQEFVQLAGKLIDVRLRKQVPSCRSCLSK
jgi:LAGLIDADG-like domain